MSTTITNPFEYAKEAAQRVKERNDYNADNAWAQAQRERDQREAAVRAVNSITAKRRGFKS